MQLVEVVFEGDNYNLVGIQVVVVLNLLVGVDNYKLVDILF